MEKFDINNIEKMFISAVKDHKHVHQDNKGTRINRENHYRFESFGKTLDTNNDYAPIEGMFNGSGSRDKRIIHSIGSKLIVMKEIRR